MLLTGRWMFHSEYTRTGYFQSARNGEQQPDKNQKPTPKPLYKAILLFTHLFLEGHVDLSLLPRHSFPHSHVPLMFPDQSPSTFSKHLFNYHFANYRKKKNCVSFLLETKTWNNGGTNRFLRQTMEPHLLSSFLSLASSTWHK